MNYSELESQFKLPKGMMSAIAGIETGGHPDPDRAISPAGAIGRFQLMPKTARELGVNPHDPDQNKMGGAKYLRWLLDQTDNDVEKAVVACNYGIGNLWKAEKNAAAIGADWKDFVKAEESRNYLKKYRASMGVGEVETKQAILPKKTAMPKQEDIKQVAPVKITADKVVSALSMIKPLVGSAL